MAHLRTPRRRLRPIGAVVVCLLIAVGCTPGTPEAGSEGETGDTTTQLPIPEQPLSPEEEAVIALSGRLAVVHGHEVSVVAPDGSDPLIVAGSDVEIASQPTWSPDGSRLAWVATDGIDSSIAAGSPGAEPEVTLGLGTTPFYLNWDDSGTTLGYLRPEVGGSRFEMGTVIPGEPVSPGQIGAPLYLSWRPDEVELALHTDADRIELLTPPDPAIPIAPTEGQFAAPVWLDDDEVLSVEGGKLVAIDTDSNKRRELLEIGDVTRFVLSPDRSRLAYLTVLAATQTVGLQTDSGAEVSLRVLDFASGRDLLVTDDVPLAFEWSPNSALLSWLGRVDATQATWHIWSSAGEYRTLAPYVPSVLDQSAYLPFYDQYAQSQNRWEPEAQAMVFAGTVGNTSGVWVELIEGDFGPFLVAEGDYATWSPPPGGGGGGASIL